jgi:hypothetical protein
MMWWSNGTWAVGDWLAFGLMLVVIWCLLVGGSVWLVLSLSNRRNTQPSPVDEDEHLRRRSHLHSAHAGSGPAGDG